MSQRFAVIGNPIDHSLSPIIHQYFAKQTQIDLVYEKMSTEASYFKSQVSNFFDDNGKGLNITSPFKQNAYEMAAIHSERCTQARAANTLWLKENQLCADNTDGIGLIRDLTRYVSLSGKRVLIFGAGGATRGIIHPLLEENLADVVIANRSLVNVFEFSKAFVDIKCITMQDIEGDFDIIINATSANLLEEFIAFPALCFSKQPFCYDLSYTQQNQTPFVQYARALGCLAVDGLGMLVEQAAEAFFIWHGIRPSTHQIIDFLRKPSKS